MGLRFPAVRPAASARTITAAAAAFLALMFYLAFGRSERIRASRPVPEHLVAGIQLRTRRPAGRRRALARDRAPGAAGSGGAADSLSGSPAGGMNVSEARFTVLLYLALPILAVPGPMAAQSTGTPGAASHGSVRGTAVDQSGGVLPGVTVVAAIDGRMLGVTQTNAAGEFSFDGLPAGSVELSFRLDGFDDSGVKVAIAPGGTTAQRAAAPLVHRMALLGVSESVTVRGDPPPAPPRPRPVVAPVPVHEQGAVCGPARAEDAVPALGTIRSRRDDETKVLFGPGDELLIDGGTSSGLAVGQNFVVRRRYPTALRYGRNRSLVVMGEHSSGLLQIVAVEDQVSTAVVVYACDEMTRGDYLAPFEPTPVLVADPPGTPVFDQPAMILFADAGQPLGVTGRMLVIDRGTRKDVRPGQRFTFFRRSRFRDARPIVVGEGVVVSVRVDSATVRVEHATDAIFFGERGDWAAPQRVSSHGGH
jgi:hypothetical protein